MARIYRSYLELLKKWPVDATKKDRDFAQYLRERIKRTFRTPELPGDEDEAECWKTYEALNRIADNQHLVKYKRYNTSSATGLTAEQCRSILSEEFIKLLDTKESGFFNSVWRKKE
ncbi:Mitochondrial nucleoid factor 1 [Nesidiocoris tenuis]|uniref:Mitochondrial nucleoid factor 1 n=1 Tax=Nesidiocoris tenuis TaxID=355587 RepID=A0ABN7AYN9_9HEMI|nr:Mitochondrial nucleoid factor 1 [Nesidiocoris tenuis]